jgi:hypothetical protein
LRQLPQPQTPNAAREREIPEEEASGQGNGVRTGQDTRGEGEPPSQLQHQVHLTHNVFEVALQKSILSQIRQFILHISNSEG